MRGIKTLSVSGVDLCKETDTLAIKSAYFEAGQMDLQDHIITWCHETSCHWRRYEAFTFSRLGTVFPRLLLASAASHDEGHSVSESTGFNQTLYNEPHQWSLKMNFKIYNKLISHPFCTFVQCTAKKQVYDHFAAPPVFYFCSWGSLTMTSLLCWRRRRCKMGSS